jgi:hypothetical protein
MQAAQNSIDPVPPSAYPALTPVAGPPPSMPPAWSGVALLHPFSPPFSSDPKPITPFFQLCVARLAYVEGEYFSAQIAGCDYGNWWFIVTPSNTRVSMDQGVTWQIVDIGWTLPSNWFGASIGKAACAGASPLNWMPGPSVDWWKVPVSTGAGNPDAATWMWFDSAHATPVRMMFGYAPPKPTRGDPNQLALFQMYSMTYMPVFEASAPGLARLEWSAPSFPGFVSGNPDKLQDFTWNANFGMTALMTPVNEAFNPLPTRVLYVWKPDARYAVASDRSQNTLMRFTYNQFSGQPMADQVALLTGPAPKGVKPPPNSDSGFLINYNNVGAPTCVYGASFPFPQEPPTWVSIPGVQATVRATITNNPVVAPRNRVAIYSVLFPPALPNYPEATYLWTWYAPLNASGTQSRPVTFMQSQSGVGVGTSLALADYFFYEEFAAPIDPANFDVPDCCSGG